jgi:hypothetical protein
VSSGKSTPTWESRAGDRCSTPGDDGTEDRHIGAAASYGIPKRTVPRSWLNGTVAHAAVWQQQRCVWTAGGLGRRMIAGGAGREVEGSRSCGVPAAQSGGRDARWVHVGGG